MDTFAAALGNLSLPTPVGLSLAEVRRRAVDRQNAGPDDFISRLIHAHGDLKRIEELASKTFNWTDRSKKRKEIAIEAMIAAKSDPKEREKSKPVAVPQPEVKVVEVRLGLRRHGAVMVTKTV